MGVNNYYYFFYIFFSNTYKKNICIFFSPILQKKFKYSLYNQNIITTVFIKIVIKKITFSDKSDKIVTKQFIFCDDYFQICH